MILIDRLENIGEIGGKAYNLFALGMKNTPKLYVCPASYFGRAEELENLLEAEINRLFSDKKLYAVRSSAADEDSSSDSFAGVHESYLNVKKSGILEHIYKVYESAFTERALAYRKTRGLGAENIKVAVIIQEMVQAEFAGVINTINPVTDNPDEIVISVTKGLGESIVDGSVSGTTYRINHGKVGIDGEDILNKKILAKLVNFAAEIAAKTAAFQDIEFAYCKGRVYFLQARAITAYGGINTQKRNLLIDNSNITESFFGVVSPLTFSFAKEVYKDVYTAALEVGGVNGRIREGLAPALAEMLYCHEGKIYYNMNSWYFALSVLPFKKSDSYFDGMIGVDSKAEERKRIKMGAFGALKLALTFLGKLRNIEKLSAQFEEEFERVVMPYYGRTLSGTNEGLIALSERLSGITRGFVIPIINDLAVMYSFGKLKEKAEKLGVSAQELNSYISSRGEVKSAESATRLMELVQVIRADKRLFTDFSDMDEAQLMKKYRDGTEISEKLNAYVYDFGARVMDELKLETVTMIEDEKLLYRQLKANLNAEYKTPEYEIAEPPKALKRLAEKTKKYMRLRERLRLKRTYLYSVVRNIFLAFGENYRRAGRLEDKRDIFYLTKREVLSGSGDFKSIVKTRKEQERENLSKPVYDRIVFFDGKPLPVKSEKAKGGLSGIPSGSGTVTAKVSLMQSPNDKLTPGNIILTKRTDPGWISLFPLASGLIVEHGSMLSHSFVVARELNLPAIVGLKDAVTLIPDGATVFLDGLNGEVKILG